MSLISRAVLIFGAMSFAVAAKAQSHADIFSVTSNSDVYVTVGSSSTFDANGEHDIKPVLLKSSDGRHWRNVSLQIKNGYLSTVTYGNGRFVIVGHANATESEPQRSVILVSRNGRVWNEAPQSAPLSYKLMSATFGNGQFWLVSEDGHVWTSRDAKKWTEIDSLRIYNPKFVFGQGQVLAHASNVIAKLQRNGRWRYTEIGYEQHNQVLSVMFDGDKWIGSGFQHCCWSDTPERIQTLMLVSEDGVNWNSQPGQVQRYVRKMKKLDFGFVGISDAQIFNSRNGLKWNPVSNHPGRVWNDVATRRDVGDAVVIARDTIYYSENGIDWNEAWSYRP